MKVGKYGQKLFQFYLWTVYNQLWKINSEVCDVKLILRTMLHSQKKNL